MSQSLTRASVLAAALTLLTACGGGSDADPVPDLTAQPAPAPAPAPAASLIPLSGGSEYLGTLSFGDTVGLSLDTANQRITLRFIDSRFGLQGAVASSYSMQADGQMLAAQFQPLAGSALPAALDQQLAALSLRFAITQDLVSGQLSGVPNLKSSSKVPLQGQLTASNRGMAQLGTLAGTYNFVQQQAGYNAQGELVRAPSVAFGQLRIQADGSLRACPSQAYGDRCSNGITGAVTADADQQNYPGALAVHIGGQRIGRAMVRARSGATTLMLDAYEAGSNGTYTTGSWTLQSAANTLPATALDGEWLCNHPELTAQGQATGRSLRHYVSIGNGLLQTDMIDTDIALTANAAPATGSAPQATANGLFAGQWQGSPPSSARVLLPVADDTLYYVGNNGNASTPRADIAGQCQRLPEQPLKTRHLNASATSADPVMVTLGEVHPTQPAVGYDQIYYKQGRYRHVATGGVPSSQWQKAFDDLCEDSGLEATAKNSVTADSQLNDRSSFKCKNPVANYQSLLKTAVVGPRGQLYLTDGHHSFTSLWEAPNSGGNPANGLAGSSVQMPVMIKGNYQEMNNASFWRQMRADKFVWLRLPDGRAITPAELPRQLGLGNGLQDDPYRSLVYFTREVGYDKPVNPSEFLEFYWSEWLQAAPRSFRLSDYQLGQAGAGNGSDKGYLQAIRDAAQLMVAANPTDTIAASDYTAQQMGRLATFGSTAFNDLNTAKPADGKKAGKLAYALEYRATLAGAR